MSRDEQGGALKIMHSLHQAAQPSGEAASFAAPLMAQEIYSVIS